VAAKTLSDEPLDAVALHCPADLLAWDREAQARRLPATPPGQHRDRFAAGFLRLFEDAFVVFSCQEAHAALELQTRLRVNQLTQTGTSSGKAGSTFGAPGFDHFAARLSSHASAKTVPALTLQSAWLKWSFHCTAPVTRTGEA